MASALRAAGAPGDTARVSAALTAFERAMRPGAASAQRLPPGRVASVAPKSALGIRVNAPAMRALRSRAARPLVDRAFAASEHGRRTPTAAGRP
ncbi:hypothetical protein ACH4PU_34250 [Streptomyces sp. NPDC021100]|uniref:hypothetical protein n=1 Tax=Streptomyces sp. NPDC021100 TaxID=3365114 RepID=UPI00378E37E4